MYVNLSRASAGSSCAQGDADAASARVPSSACSGGVAPTPGGREVPDELKEWLNELLAKVREIVNESSNVASFTVTVGAPMAVTVAVTFAHAAQ